MAKNYITLLQEITTHSRWTQVELANRIGVTHAALSRWLHCKAVPQRAHSLRISQIHRDIIGIQPVPRGEIKSLLKYTCTLKIRNIYQVLSRNEQLRQDLNLELTYNSNSIEGSSFTKKETDAVIFDHALIQTKTLDEHLAATNHAQALDDIFRGHFKGGITEQRIRSLHKIIMQGIRPDSGEYAASRRGIRGVDLVLPHPDDIPEEMGSFVQMMNGKNGVHDIEHITKCHSDFESIHPFSDGNGRVGRLMLCIQLLDLDYPPVLVEKNRKAAYYDALEFAGKKSATHLVKFIAEGVEASYRVFQKYRE